VTPNHITLLSRNITVNGLNYGSGKSVTISIVQGGSTKQTVTAGTASDGSFSKPISVSALVTTGTATVTACDSYGCASQTITVTVL